jgi:hypothetical protein
MKYRTRIARDRADSARSAEKMNGRRRFGASRRLGGICDFSRGGACRFAYALSQSAIEDHKNIHTQFR